MAKVKAKSKIGDIEFDVLLSEKTSEQVQTTEHPVETGTDPTDHARILPIRLTLEGVLTNTPTVTADRDARGRAPIEANTGYAQRKYDELLKLKSGQALLIVTPARTYRNMQINEVSRTRDSKLGTDTIQFTVQLKEIVFVSTGTTRLQPKTSVSNKVTGNKKQSKKAATSEPNDVRSREHKLANSLLPDAANKWLEEGSSGG